MNVLRAVCAIFVMNLMFVSCGRTQDQAERRVSTGVDSTEALVQNKRVVLDYVAAFNRGDVNALGRLFTADALVYGVLGWGSVDQIKPIWQDIIESFNIQLHVESIVTEGDIVAVRYTERGKSVGPFRGVAPTGREYEVVAMEWFVIKDGLIHRRWGARDSATIFSKMGLPLS